MDNHETYHKMTVILLFCKIYKVKKLEAFFCIAPKLSLQKYPPTWKHVSLSIIFQFFTKKETANYLFIGFGIIELIDVIIGHINQYINQRIYK